MDVVVTLGDEQAERIDSVAEELRAAGLNVAQVLSEIGVVSGSVERSRLKDVEAVRGVASVEESREVRLPPPDEPVQ